MATERRPGQAGVEAPATSSARRDSTGTSFSSDGDYTDIAAAMDALVPGSLGCASAELRVSLRRNAVVIVNLSFHAPVTLRDLRQARAAPMLGSGAICTVYNNGTFVKSAQLTLGPSALSPATRLHAVLAALEHQVPQSGAVTSRTLEIATGGDGAPDAGVKQRLDPCDRIEAFPDETMGALGWGEGDLLLYRIDTTGGDPDGPSA